MAIKIQNLEEIARKLKPSEFTFKDMKLDFESSGRYDATLGTKIQGNDIKVSLDEQAIRNSLRNLFNTKPGQRFLFPLYGLDLYQFLFTAVTKDNARVIGEAIVAAVDLYEPRVTVENCNVNPLPDENLYDITLVVRLPAFSTTTVINSQLDLSTQSFIFVNTSRNR